MIEVILKNPIEGYEIEAECRIAKKGEMCIIGDDAEPFKVQLNTSYPVIVLTPKLKKYGWSKTSVDCLVYLATGALCPLSGSIDIKPVGIYEGWQAITDGGYPIDESAVNVEYRKSKEGETFRDYDHSATQYRVISLKDGYKY